MNLKKLDKRMTGYGTFLYSVDFSYRHETLSFAEVRKWCIDTWGNSVEIDIWHNYPTLRNPAWSWERHQSAREYTCRIFLVSEGEAAWFKLRWA
jgi:hypothetical protein